MKVKVSISLKVLINISRIIVGVLFIFSGLIKANDPLGLSYKMLEFFEVWNFHWLDNYTLAFSILMIVFEIVAGIAVLLGWHMKLFGWLLLLLIVFFTFLTGYAFFSGKVRECGCFGNCIPLTAGESFSKDLILGLLIVFLFLQRDRVKPFLPRAANLSILVIGTVLSFSLQWFVLQYLPVVDCLPYKIGVNIEEQMKSPPGSRPDSVVTTFRYLRNGKMVEIINNNFPADFDDSYKLVSRSDKLLRKGNDTPPIKDFSLTTSAGNDTTRDLLQVKGYTVFMFVRQIDEPSPSWNKAFNLVYTFWKLKNIPVYFVTSSAETVQKYLQANRFSEGISLLTCDATAVKTAARANPTLYLVKKGTIIGKWGYADFENAVGALGELSAQQP